MNPAFYGVNTLAQKSVQKFRDFVAYPAMRNCDADRERKSAGAMFLDETSNPFSGIQNGQYLCAVFSGSLCGGFNCRHAFL